MTSFAMSQGVTVEEMQAAMGMAPKPEPKPAAPKVRARVTGGKFKADDPATPDENEAWQEN